MIKSFLIGLFHIIRFFVALGLFASMLLTTCLAAIFVMFPDFPLRPDAKWIREFCGFMVIVYGAVTVAVFGAYCAEVGRNERAKTTR